MPPLSLSTVMGSLLGGAVGDAMGAPFEGLWTESIPSAESLAHGFHEYHGYPRGQYTDDTQLTLASVESLVAEDGIVLHDIARRMAELWRHHSVIGPGGACTQAAERFLATGNHRNMGAPAGQAGNGTAMRTAALGLWFGTDHETLVSQVAAISRLTHEDPRSVAGGVVIAMATNLLAGSETVPDPQEFCTQLADSCRAIHPEMAELLLELPARMNSPTVLDFIAFAGQRQPEFDRPIISPFIIPTVLAALYCLLAHPTSWIQAVTTAIRLGGDVDTLGAIVGAIAGARDGMEAIPNHLVETVQDAESIRALATNYHRVICRQTSFAK